MGDMADEIYEQMYLDEYGEYSAKNDKETRKAATYLEEINKQLKEGA